MSTVKAWRETVTIPTYEVGQPEKNPIFLEKRVYQGSSGVVYPYPVIESIANETTDHEWQAVFLENEYIKVMILPELGGRVQMAYDKIKQRHFVYYNHVIKPALVGLLGPWISGGIEFNWPQHHRPSTYMPVDTSIEENADGSVTVWVNEMEKMFHQKGMAGFTLRPGFAYLEIKGVLYNRTDVPQTFLWWANPAVEVNDAYQSVFPPDINAVFDHGKRAVSRFPIATGTYYKMDYSAGVDISNYKNIYVPTSYMGVNSRFNFEGGYENDTQAGMLHVASHHFSPGKKQWTWGNGDFGRAWDRNLTDCVEIDDGKLKTENCVGTQQTDNKQAEGNFQLSTLRSQLRPGFRPYIELMAGVYTENQPDFTWLMPYEEKSFVQYFMPYRELGVVKQASKDLIMNIEQVDELSTIIRFKVFATSKQEVRIVLRNDDGTIYYNKVVTITPEEVLTEAVDVKSAKFNELTFDIFKTFVYGERSVLSWHAEPDDIRPIPHSAEAALLPEEVKTNEQLYLTGLHLEQYRHATWLATDYYEEALRRDPNDIRCLNAMGLWYIRKGRFALAEEYLRKAVKLLQKRNPNPYDGEPIYNLALSLKYQQKYAEAYELFWKATWNKGWADAGYFEAAKISTMQGRYEDALDEVNRCLVSNWHNHKARALKTAILRKLRKMEEAISLIEESLAFDLFNYGCMYEHYLIRKDQAILDKMKQMMRQSGQNYDELALDYMTAGLDEEANAIWNIAISEGAISPMTYYYMNSLTPCSAQRDACRSKNLSPKDEGSDYLCKAETMPSDYCFPNRPEDIIALEGAKRENPKGSKAPYYLGCLYYAARQYDLATRNWQLSADIDPKFPTVWRNLALTAYNKQHNREQALEYMQRAFHLDETDARILMELDQLYKVTQMPHVQRLAFLRQYPKLLSQRDDLVLEEITLLNQVGSYEEAMQKLDAHIFHPWEGGEGKVPAQYQKCRVELAKKAIFNKEYEHAIILLSQCLAYPPHLGEGKLYGAQENDFYYLQGIAYDALGNEKMAHECWQRATEGPTEPAAAMYYNDAKSDKIFYAGLAYRKLGEEYAARRLFNRLVDYGEKHLFDTVRMDYFAVSLPDLLIWDGDLGLKNTIHCNLMMALGHLGLGNTEKGLRFLEEVERLDINHGVPSDVRSLLRMVEK